MPEPAPVTPAAPAQASEPAKLPPGLAWLGDISFESDYRARFIHVDLDRKPAAAPETAENILTHRLRVQATKFVEKDLMLVTRFTTQTSRWGDFDLGTGAFSERQFDFDKFFLYWFKDESTRVFLGRSTTGYFDADLVIATGRFDDEDRFFESLLMEHNLNKKTMLTLSANPWLLSTRLLDADSRELRLGGYVLQLRHQFNEGERLMFLLGMLDPNRPVNLPGVPVALGQKPYRQAMLRYDKRLSPGFKAFASASLNLTQTDGVTFLALPGASEGDRAAAFGGVTVGDSQKREGHQLDLYYTKTGPSSTNLVAEFPNGISEVRAFWSHQFRPSFWLRASAAHRVTDTLPAGVTRADSNTAFVDIIKKF